MKSLTTIKVLALSLLIFSFGNLFAQEEEATEQEATSQEEIAAMETAAKALTKAVSIDDFTQIEEHICDVAFARVLSAKATESMSDEEVETKMLGPLKERFKENITMIRSKIEEAGLKYKDVKFVEVYKEPSTDPPMVPRVMLITMGTDEKQAGIPVTFIYNEGEFYVFEILISTGEFKTPD